MECVCFAFFGCTNSMFYAHKTGTFYWLHCIKKLISVPHVYVYISVAEQDTKTFWFKENFT